MSASLIRAPDFKDSKDVVRLDLIASLDEVAYYDSEFILKVGDISQGLDRKNWLGSNEIVYHITQ